MTFHQDLHRQSSRHQALSRSFDALADWLRGEELLTPDVADRLDRLRQQTAQHKLMVAFVAEFSRGKSELINALFFADYGQRIMPASAGRTTMCPTELGYDPELAPCIRLLPIETRSQAVSLREWRERPEVWTEIPLQVEDAAQIAMALEKVSEVHRLSPEEAMELGLWHDEAPERNPPLDAEGRVEVPRWRHALINLPHPLLRQGLVVLDTPGLNAIGAEPELTLSLLPQAHALVFILAADAGVSRSDLDIWQQHLNQAIHSREACLVVLNKVDAMWDGLSTGAQVQRQIEGQVQGTAQVLGVAASRVLPVSAQKGLLAKVQGDADLLVRSGLPQLERALADHLMGRRERLLGQALDAGVAALLQEVSLRVEARCRDLTEQIQELQALRGKNESTIRLMRQRIAQEQADFERSGVRIHALRSVHHKLTLKLYDLLGAERLQDQIFELSAAMGQKGLRLGVKGVYQKAFSKLRRDLEDARQMVIEMHQMLDASFRQLNAEFAFSLQLGDVPSMVPYADELDRIEISHLQYIGMGLGFGRSREGERLVRALTGRLRVLQEGVLNEVEAWSRTASSQIDTQLRERRRNYERRLEAVDRIQSAAGELDGRITELQAQQEQVRRNEIECALRCEPMQQAAREADGALADLPAGG